LESGTGREKEEGKEEGRYRHGCPHGDVAGCLAPVFCVCAWSRNESHVAVLVIRLGEGGRSDGLWTDSQAKQENSCCLLCA
jgi:hypothetical protein